VPLRDWSTRGRAFRRQSTPPACQLHSNRWPIQTSASARAASCDGFGYSGSPASRTFVLVVTSLFVSFLFLTTINFFFFFFRNAQPNYEISGPYSRHHMEAFSLKSSSWSNRGVHPDGGGWGVDPWKYVGGQRTFWSVVISRGYAWECRSHCLKKTSRTHGNGVRMRSGGFGGRLTDMN